MPRRIRLHPYLTDHELHEHYRRTHDPVERSHWHFLWLLASGMTATASARLTGYSAYWIGQIARRYNTDGPDGVRDQRHARPHKSAGAASVTADRVGNGPGRTHIPRATAGADGPWLPG